MTSLAEQIARDAERSVRPVKSYDVTPLTRPRVILSFALRNFFVLAGVVGISALLLIAPGYIRYALARMEAGVSLCSNPELATLPGECHAGNCPEGLELKHQRIANWQSRICYPHD